MAYEKLILSTRPGRCTECKRYFPVSAMIMYNTGNGTVRHVKCPKVAQEAEKRVEGRKE